MKLLDKILRLFGYENIENIKITWDFFKHPPRKEKMKLRRKYYKAFRDFYVPIILDKRRVLKDGYTSYLIAKENNIKYVKVVRV